jgi:hypothetical protein
LFLSEKSFEAINNGLDEISQASQNENSANASTFQGKN